jgi:hypothetical protein
MSMGAYTEQNQFFMTASSILATLSLWQSKYKTEKKTAEITKTSHLQD